MSENSTRGAQPTEEPRGIPRRAVVRGAAWSLPVIAAAVAAPLASASAAGGGGTSTPGTGGQMPLVSSYQAGTFCKHPGNPKYYHGTFAFENRSSAPLTIVLGAMLVNGRTRDAKFSVNGRLVSSYTVPAKKKVSLYVDAGQFDDSANGTATLSFAYSDAGVARTGSVKAPLGSLPPCAGEVKGAPAHAHSGPAL